MGCLTTRLAPSPTGALHLGNVRTFLANYLLARQGGWRVLLRVEDLDGPRIKPAAANQMIEELTWLGLRWDGQAVYQSQRQDLYAQALARLVADGWAYPCTCSRSDVAQAASAPHGLAAGGAYPGTCRGQYASAEIARARTGRPAAWRVVTDGEPIAFTDRFAGRRQYRLDDIGGDFVVVKSDGTAAYQLAVVVDDAAAGVDAIVRGDDLLDSTARQIHLRRLLGLGGDVEYWHLPLVVGPDGRRLAKRHGDTRLSWYRGLGAAPGRVLGLMGLWLGAFHSRREAGMEEMVEAFDIHRVPGGPIVFTSDDDAWLRGA